MVHRQFLGREAPLAVETDSSGPFALPPFGAAQLPCAVLLTLNVSRADFCEELFHADYGIPVSTNRSLVRPLYIIKTTAMHVVAVMLLARLPFCWGLRLFRF